MSNAIIAEVLNMRPNIPLISVLWLVFFLVGCDGNSNSSHNEDVVVTPTSDCLWAGGDIKKNEHLNFAMGDTNAAYWVAVYVLPEENAYVTFDHEFPHSRFISYNTYSAVLAWVDDLVDWEILPAASAINPFVEGNPRNNL